MKARSLMLAKGLAHAISTTRPLTLDEALGLVALYASEGNDKAWVAYSHSGDRLERH